MRILVITYTFLPEAEVGALRAARFCQYLPDQGIQPIVLTVQEKFYKSRDDSLRGPAGLRIERTTVLSSPLDWYGRWKAHSNAAKRLSNSVAASPEKDRRYSPLRNHVLALLQIPDPYWGWYLPAVQAAGRLVEEEPVSAIFSTGPPWAAHLIARRLRKKYQLPWVADFRDPWTCRHSREDLPGWRQRLDQRLEASCLRWADRVICNTERLRKAMAELHPALSPAKFVTLTNGFDDPVAQRASVRPEGSACLLLHLGSLYGRRRIDTFCQAVGDLVSTRRIDVGSFKILFLGDVDPDVRAVAQRIVPDLLQNNCIEFRPRVSWLEASQALWSADLLLLFFDEQLAVPAKFYEYLPTGKPMFAVAPEGALTDVLQSTGAGISVSPESPGEIADGFLRALELPSRPREEMIRRWSNQYHFRSLTQRLAGIIRECVPEMPTPEKRTGLRPLVQGSEGDAPG